MSILPFLPHIVPPSALEASVRGLGREAPLAFALDAHLALAPAVRQSGPDPVTEAALRLVGLVEVGVVARRVRLTGSTGLSLLAVPTPLWHEEASRARLMQLKAAARARAARLILVPEEALRREPVLTNALLIAACSAVPLTMSERLILTQGLADQGGSADLATCASWLGAHRDPVDAVLRLAGERRVRLDLTQPVNEGSLVHLVQA